MNTEIKKVLQSKILNDEVLHETVALLDEKFTSYKEVGEEIPEKVLKYYHEVQKVGRQLLETDNRIVAAALDKENPTVLLIELEMDYNDEIYGATSFEVNDETGALESIHLEQVK